MRNAFRSLILLAFALACFLSVAAQNREKFVISAHAGGVNAVTGRATMHTPGNNDWQQLTSQDDLSRGDVVQTGIDGRVEMLLNPGSYLRIGENSEFELTDNSLENLEVRLIRGTAIVEVTGADDEELSINITTPHARMAIVRRGLYRVNVVPGDATELIVRKGRVMLDGNHMKVKGGNKVVFSDTSFSVAKLQKDEKGADDLDSWSKNRAIALAKSNSRITSRDVNSMIASFGDNWWFLNSFERRGLWMYDTVGGCFTFFPFGYGWSSPYGNAYVRTIYDCCNRRFGFGTPGFGWPSSGGGWGTSAGGGAGSGSGSGSGNGSPSAGPSFPSNASAEPTYRSREVSPRVHRPAGH